MATQKYQTSDFLTAAVLTTLRHKLVGLDRSNSKRVVFEFENTPVLKTDIARLKNRELHVDPLDLWAAERRCKQLIYEGQSND